MRYAIPVLFRCDGCPATGQGVREVAEFAVAEVDRGAVQPIKGVAMKLSPQVMALPVAPEGWQPIDATPSGIIRAGKVDLDPFAHAGVVADTTGVKQTGVLCPDCLKKAGLSEPKVSKPFEGAAS